MPFDPSEWKKNIKGVIERISDEKYQRLAWFNRHEEFSSPGELINQLYADYEFESFIDSSGVALTPSQRASAANFSELLLKFCQDTPKVLDPYKIIDDTRWCAIRHEAGKLLKVLFPNEPLEFPSSKR